MSYVYVKSEPNLFTVGFYDPAGKWHSDSDHATAEEAAQRVAYLNGAGAVRGVLDGPLNSGDGVYRP
jgi:hypothetical protein